MLVLNLDDDEEEDLEEEIFVVGVRRRRRRRKRSMKLFRPIVGQSMGQALGQGSVRQPRFDDYFFEEQQSYRIQGPSYNFANAGYFHDYDYDSYSHQVVPPSRMTGDPYEAPDPHHQNNNLKEISHDHYIDYQDNTHNSEHFEVIHSAHHDHHDYHDHHDHQDHYIDEHHLEHHQQHFPRSHFHKTMFRNLYDPPKAIRNQRDFRYFPGIEPAGVKGVTPKLLDFISGRVMELAMSIQDSPHHEEGNHF